MYLEVSFAVGVEWKVAHTFITVESPASAGESIGILAGAYFAMIALASVASDELEANRSSNGWNQYMPLAAPALALMTGGAEHGSMDRIGFVLPRLLSAVRMATHCDGLSSSTTSGE